MMDRLQRLANRLLFSLVAGDRKVNLSVVLDTRRVALQLSHSSKLPYRREEATVGALLPLEDVLEVRHRATVFSRQVSRQLRTHEYLQGFDQEPQ
jgi:hypothetical protein